jgi:hypothetical protein
MIANKVIENSSVGFGNEGDGEQERHSVLRKAVFLHFHCTLF